MKRLFALLCVVAVCLTTPLYAATSAAAADDKYPSKKALQKEWSYEGMAFENRGGNDFANMVVATLQMQSSQIEQMAGIKAGDVVIIRDADMRTMELTVSGVYYNYVYNYMIVNPETVEMNWGETPEIQMALVRALDGQDVHQVSAEVVSMDNVMNVSVSEDLALMVHNMMDALDLVVWVIVFCAALLAATVLYNLTNININERIREIATIKVLGFNATETGMYIFKENLILSIMGAGMGLLFGKFLLDFVMDQIKINMVWFLSRALPMSYVLSVIITIFMALVVDFVFYFKLQKINMAEALKSVE